jgi:hypothetical protein
VLVTNFPDGDGTGIRGDAFVTGVQLRFQDGLNVHNAGVLEIVCDCVQWA